MFLTIVAFVVILSLLVFVHELGHFWVARKFGVKAEEFGFGFPPRAFGLYKSKDGKWKKAKGNEEIKDAADTIYSVNWVPLGGFVKLGEDDIEENDDPNHFNNKSFWQRTAILLAGVTMNVILAGVLISLGFMIGLPQVLHDVNPAAKISERKIQIVEVLDDSPAKTAGLKIGDAILNINGNNFDSSDSLQNFVGEKAGDELNYAIKRGTEELNLVITPEFREDTGMGGIGVGITETGLVKYPIHVAIWEGIKTTIFWLWAIIVAFFSLLKGIIFGQGIGADVAGPIGIAALTGEVARLGFVYILQFTAMLSINLAVINAFPFPALDGGRILFLIIEKIKGSPVKREVEAVIHNIGFALLMILILFVTFKDVARHAGWFTGIWSKIVG